MVRHFLQLSKHVLCSNFCIQMLPTLFVILYASGAAQLIFSSFKNVEVNLDYDKRLKIYPHQSNSGFVIGGFLGLQRLDLASHESCIPENL